MTKRFSSFAIVAGSFGLLASVLAPSTAHAIPSFAAQTGQPCSACHVGAFGPQLKPYGRDFKLRGYVTSDRDNNADYSERLTMMAKASFNRTNADQASPPTHYGPNDNFSLDQVAAYYGGRITPTIGMIQELSYDGTNRTFFWDALDARRAFEGEFLGEDFIAGVVVSNQLGNTSIWNSGTPNGFPYNSSDIAPTPQAGTLFDDSLNGKILGAGAYGLWNDWIFGELTAYVPLSRNFQQAVGNPAADRYDGVIPYWHVAVQHELDHHKHYFQVGTYGAVADRFPGLDASTGETDHITDLGFEANYQYLADLDNVISFHTTFVHENQKLTASRSLNSTNPADHLNTFNADVTYSIKDTFVPTLQYFKTTGSTDAALYTNATNGSPNSEGFTAELAYLPFGRPDSYVQNANLRLALQYTAYTRFDGTSKHASDNNTLFLSMIWQMAPFKASFGGGK